MVREAEFALRLGRKRLQQRVVVAGFARRFKALFDAGQSDLLTPVLSGDEERGVWILNPKLGADGPRFQNGWLVRLSITQTQGLKRYAGGGAML